MHIGAAAVLMVLTIAVSLVCFQSPRIADALALRPDRVLERHEYYRLITCGFVHADVGHLFFNMLTFYFFGFTLERVVIGTEAFVVLYFAALIVSSFGSALKHRHDPGYSAVGASGAILGVLFASIVYFPEQKLFLLPVPVPIPAPLFAIGYLAYSIYSARLAQQNPRRGRINHDAHLYGAVTGLLFVAIATPGAYAVLLAKLARMFN